MRLFRFLLVSFGLLCLLFPALWAQRDRENPGPEPVGTLELTVRDLHGEPLKRANIEIFPLLDNPFQTKTPSVQAKTDERGVARFFCPAGVQSCRLVAHGVGYAILGTFEVLEEKTTRLTAPLLLPFAVVEGTVPAEARKDGTTVRMLGLHNDSTEWDAKGRFVFRNVPCGQHGLKVYAGDKDLDWEAFVKVAPGQRVQARFLQREVPKHQGDQPASPARAAPKEKPGKTVWASGHVRDENGRPVSGATVFAIASFHGGIRMYETIQSVRTDGEGRYRIEGDENLSMLSVRFVAHKTGQLPAFRSQPRSADTPCDLILPARGGKLEVTVVENKKPRAGVSVQLSVNAGPGLYNSHYVGSAHGPDRDRLTELLYPVATTDADGMARFSHLLPGIYTIHAVAGDKQAVAGFREAVFLASARASPCVRSRYRRGRRRDAALAPQHLSATESLPHARHATGRQTVKRRKPRVFLDCP